MGGSGPGRRWQDGRGRIRHLSRLLGWLVLLGLATAVEAQNQAPQHLRLLEHAGEAPPTAPWDTLAGRALPAVERHSLGIVDAPVWLAVTLAPYDGPRLLHLDNPLLHEVALYHLREGAWQPVARSVMETLTGERRPAWRPIYRVETPGRYLLKIDSTQSLRFALKDQSPQALARDWRAFTLGQGLYLGLVLGLVLYNSVLLLSLRDASYFWYLGFVLGAAGYFVGQKGLLHEVWPSLPIATNEALMFTALAIGSTSALQFCRRFLLMHREDPVVGRWLRAVGWFAAVGIALAWTHPGHPTVIFFSVFGAAVLLLFLVAAIRALRRRFRPARWLLLAWAALVAGAAAFILATYGWLPHHFLTYYGFQLGSAIEVTLLSLALADRISLLHRERQSLLDEQARLKGMSYTDGLTGLGNRRFLDEYLAAAAKPVAGEAALLSLVLLDIDHFKQFNDRCGHLEGDRALQHLAAVLREAVRHEDPVCRYGGEEFVLVLPGHDEARAVEIAERFRAGLVRRPLRLEDGGLVYLTATLGVACRQPGEPPESLLGRADRALYRGKRAGRNRVVFDRPEGEEPQPVERAAEPGPDRPGGRSTLG
ncbi:diguanylate cyclase [Halomonas sp. NO4]|uniref:sensor domain-containing diguanylate cyclase n=1 Tax=Halomonas sp. NO4 TaxID=2484813 RepID=UPI0013D6BB61|nr:diguanylate cyclase [Halomonas sp. NO4]